MMKSYKILIILQRFPFFPTKKKNGPNAIFEEYAIKENMVILRFAES